MRFTQIRTQLIFIIFTIVCREKKLFIIRITPFLDCSLLRLSALQWPLSHPIKLEPLKNVLRHLSPLAFWFFQYFYSSYIRIKFWKWWRCYIFPNPIISIPIILWRLHLILNSYIWVSKQKRIHSFLWIQNRFLIKWSIYCWTNQWIRLLVQSHVRFRAVYFILRNLLTCSLSYWTKLLVQSSVYYQHFRPYRNLIFSLNWNYTDLVNILILWPF